MGKIMLRQKEVSSVRLRATVPGSRAVFLVELRSTEEQAKVRELFGALAELGEVIPLCEGAMMAYVVQLRHDNHGGVAGSLFTKIEATLREEFAFSLVERSFNEVVYHLVESLCTDSGGRMHAVPRCGICNQPEPFPTRVTLCDPSGRGIIEACYCARCAAQQADPSDKQFILSLLGADRRLLLHLDDARLLEAPSEGIAEPRPLATYQIAS